MSALAGTLPVLGTTTAGGAALSGDPAAFHQAMLDWRRDRPHNVNASPDFDQTMRDWRMARPVRGQPFPPPGNPTPGVPQGQPQTLPAPVGGIQPANIMAPGSQGQSLYV